MSRVVSVNVGMPRDVPWRGRLVRTAIWKRPVDGRVFAGRLNLVGDGQADLDAHGGEQRAVMVYQVDSYRYWSDFLGRSDFETGQFGENLTVEGLADSDVCMGDRYRIGGAVFEVTQPRVTCYRLGIRMGHEQMPALMVAHRRPGFYFRVLEEGEIGAGDLIEKIADGPERMSVTEIDQLLYTADHPTEALRRAVRISALSPGWQGSMNSLLDAAIAGRRAGNAGLSAAPAAAPSWNGMRRLQIVASKSESEDIRSFDLAADDGSGLPDALPGQHVVVRLRPRVDSAPVLRNYSLCGAPGQGIYRIAVKRERDGIASHYLHEHTKVGDLLEVSAPRGSFVLESGASPVVLMSAGVGITPLMAMLKTLETQGSSPREIWWVHSARDGAHHPFADEVRGLIAGLSAGRSFVFYSALRPTISRVVTMTRRVVSTRRGCRSRVCRCPEPFIFAAQRDLWARSRPRCGSRAFRRIEFGPSCSVRPQRHPTARSGRPHTRRAANLVEARRSPSSAAASRCPGMDVSAVCSNLPKPAMSPCIGPAAPASVIVASAASSMASLNIHPIRSIRRAKDSL
jgi:MOSC domain-containing protein YiiM/ferredoxin-NADP reductase